MGDPPIMTSGRLSLPSTPINTLGSPNEVHPRGVPGRWWVPASQALRQPLHRPVYYVQHLNATLHQSTHPLDKVGRPSQEWTEDTRVGLSGSLDDEEWGPPTHPRGHEELGIPSQTARARHRPIGDKRRLMTESWVFLPILSLGENNHGTGRGGRAAGGNEQAPC